MAKKTVAKKSVAKSSAKAVTLSVNFIFERETPNTLRFQEADANGKAMDFGAGIVGTLYVKKAALKGKAPKKLSITINA